MALELTQPLTEMITRNLSWGQLAGKTDNLTAPCELSVQKICEPQLLTTLRASMACCRDSFIFLQKYNDYHLHQFSTGQNNMAKITYLIEIH
jgi:hypothetical protein